MWHAWRHVRPIAAAAQRRWGRVAPLSSSGRTPPSDGDWFAEIVKLARSLPQETLAAAVAEAERRKLTPASTFSTLLSPPQRERGGSSRARRRGADGLSELEQMPDEAPMPTGNAALVALSSNELGMWLQLWDEYVNDKDLAGEADRTSYISSSVRRRALRSLLASLQSSPTGITELLEPWEDAKAKLHRKFMEHALHTYSPAINQYRILKQLADMRLPHQWFPAARQVKRHVVYHYGPTNSGKTHSALTELKGAERGIYCAPLRLLALEIFDRLNADGVACSLLTGQERQIVAGETHLSCTVEMAQANLGRGWDVAVLDEIQMIGDQSRGAAWTEAFLALPAARIHLCGDPSALELIERLCSVSGDSFEAREYDRRSPLIISRTTMPTNLDSLQKGDCIVAFSRRDIYYYKRMIESMTRFRCCVVYGRLPPETRAAQARLFNEQSGHDILVASDAVGMGLNLNIRRVIFTTTTKFDGVQDRVLHASQIKQIAGRAGRYGSMFPQGEVTALAKHDLKVIRKGMYKDVAPLTKAGLSFRDQQLQTLAQHNPHLPLSGLMDLMARLAQLDGNYFMCDYEDLKIVADAIENIRGLSFQHRLVFVKAPVTTRSTTVIGHLVRFAEQFAALEDVRFGLLPRTHIRDDKDLADLEDFHQVADLYIWLAFRLDRFVDYEHVKALREEATALITHALESGMSVPVARRRKPAASKRSKAKMTAEEGLGVGGDSDEQLARTLREYFASQSGVATASS